MNASVAQWIGSRRTQEDAYGVKHFPEGVLVVVCDGMGGHHHGSLASATAVKAFVRHFEESEISISVAERLSCALEEANDAVGREFCRCDSYGGTTLVAAYVGAGVLWWVSVGDSPLFLWRQGRLIRLNKDHSMRAVYLDFVGEGCMSRREAIANGHLLRSALTGEPIPLIDNPPTPYPLLPGDRIMLATDGIEDLLQAQALTAPTRDLLNSREGELSPRIIEAIRALNNPMADNVTVVCLDWV